MIPTLLAFEWADFSLPAFILALIGLLLGIRNATKKPPPARVRPFNHFKLVNKAAKPITVASSSGHAQPNGGGTVLFGPIDLGPPLFEQPPPQGQTYFDNRGFDYTDPNSGPDNVKSVKLHLKAQGDSVERDLSPIQVPPSPTAPANNYRYIEATEVTIESVSETYVYTVTVVTSYYTGVGITTATHTSTYQIPPPPP